VSADEDSDTGNPLENAKNAGLTKAQIHAAEKLLLRALQWRAIPSYSAEEHLVLAILAAYFSYQQRVRGKKSKGALKKKAECRRQHVNLLLRYVVSEKYRSAPNSNATVMKIVTWLDEIGIEASESQVRRDIHDALKLGPLSTQ
jgi:hypothetical protein